jgi:hypothetical protein
LKTPEIPKELPHQIVKGVLDGLASIPASVSGDITVSLNKGPLGDAGPHNAVNDVVQAGSTAVKDLGAGVSEALDTPADLVRK